MKTTVPFLFFSFLCYGEGKQEQTNTHAQKIVFIILSFYTGLVERFPEIRQCLVIAYFVQRGNSSITSLSALLDIQGRASAIIFEHLLLVKSNLAWYQVVCMKTTVPFLFFSFLCYGEGKQEQTNTHAQKIVFIILSFYTGLVERFPEIRQCLVIAYFVQRGNSSITSLSALLDIQGRASAIIFACKITQLCSHTLLLIPVWYGATVGKKKKKKEETSYPFAIWNESFPFKVCQWLIWSQATQAQAQATSH